MAGAPSPHAGDNPLVVYIGAVLIVPIFLTVGIWMIRRPAQAYRVFWFWSDKPPTKFDLVWSRVFGCIFTAGTAAWAIGLVVYLISN